MLTQMPDGLPLRASRPGSSLAARGAVLAATIVLLWAVFLVRMALPGQPLGIVPRSRGAVAGILSAPFFHGGVAHLAANSAAFLVLGSMVLMRGIRTYFVVIITSMLVGGAGVWLFGAAGTNHIGASGVIFGFIGYLIFAGVFERSLASLGLAFAAAFLYGGALLTAAIPQQNVSWSGHAYGFLGGVVAAGLVRKRNATSPRR